MISWGLGEFIASSSQDTVVSRAWVTNDCNCQDGLVKRYKNDTFKNGYSLYFKQTMIGGQLRKNGMLKNQKLYHVLH